jgi:biopolymer transport protein ExbB/TolQ
MTDKELIETLRGRNGFGWTEDAADRIEQLVEDNKSLSGAQESLVETLRESGCKRREAEAKLKTAEEIGRAFEEDAGQLRAKLAKVVDVIKHILNIAPEGDEDEWHIALDTAAALLAELKKTE